ncbi:hypothetical protein M422DRAFT_59508 [Sphaerobolus stellatus SS14]|nr:hypothetical protein M422DRAFT_59508 [Sphaerobolus stellatus SS14]
MAPFIQLSRIDMLSGSLLMFWPCMWGLLASAYRAHIPLPKVLVQVPFYFVGSVLLHSIACTWNDICDRDLDAQVDRTKHRPLASGTVSVRSALIFCAFQIIVFLAFIMPLSKKLAFQATIFGLCVWQPVYPFLKRITHWPQAWLPLVMNWGLVIVWLENVDREGLDVVMTLLLGSFCWSIYYDTIYATMDVKDDIRIGIKSTAVLFASWTRFILSLFSCGFIICLIIAGMKNGQGPAYFVLGVSGTGLILFWQLSTWDLADPQSSFERFDMNGRVVGKVVASGLALDYLLYMYQLGKLLV